MAEPTALTDSRATICRGPEMREVARKNRGIRWCFACRKRHEFWQVVTAPAEPSYYGPNIAVRGERYGCDDLGFGRDWEWGEDW